MHTINVVERFVIAAHLLASHTQSRARHIGKRLFAIRSYFFLYWFWFAYYLDLYFHQTALDRFQCVMQMRIGFFILYFCFLGSGANIFIAEWIVAKHTNKTAIEIKINH